MFSPEQQKERDYLKVFQEVTRFIGTVHDPQQVMDLVVRRLPELLEVDAATIRLFDHATDTLVLEAAWGVSDEYLSRPIIDTREVMARVLQGRPAARTGIERLEDYDSCAHVLLEGVQSAMSLPIVFQGQVIGLLRLLTKDARHFTDDEIDFAMSLAEHVGSAIEKARTYRQITLLFNQIEEHERLLQTIIDSLWMQLLVIGADGRVVLANRMFLEMQALSEGEVLGRDYQGVSPWTAYEQPRVVLEEVLAERRPVAALHQLDTEGGRRWFERHLTPILGSSGRVEFVTEAVRDITDQKLLEQEKLARVKLEGVIEMAGTAAHELNSPLFAALGTAQLLRDDLTESAHREELDAIIGSLEHITAITRRMTAATGFTSKDYVGRTKIVELTTAPDDPNTVSRPDREE